MKEDIKKFPQSFLDRALLVVFSFSLSSGSAYFAYSLYFKENEGLILFLCLFGASLLSLYLGIMIIINPARVELTNNEIIFITRYGGIKKCDWSEINDFYFYYNPANRNPYKAMCFKKKEW